MTLEEIRREIDAIDDRLLRLLQARMEQALLARRFKGDVEDPKREREVITRIIGGATPEIGSEFVQRIFTLIIEESKRFQEEDRALMAFQGEHGAYGEEAARVWDPDMVPFPCATFEEVFERLRSGSCDVGIVPVENTLGGSVEQVNRLLIQSDLHVVGAVVLPVRHCLLALPGADHREIRTVVSHPQALFQCRRFLERNRLEPIPYADTAGAARMLAETRPPRCAAIAASLCSRLYRLEILKEGIQDMEKNHTRFLVLSRERASGEGNKCSMVFATEHKAGTLFRVLELFAREAINLTRIESIPNEPGDYAFFLDFEGSERDTRVVGILESVREMTIWSRLLGCYTERRIP